ncbi:hypothetical protein MUP79_08690, partial [Candidatus Bathyarchaeota archaeon]|nr:hypothetical protein [Candidatus Bathyarchaeota archaeon]
MYKVKLHPKKCPHRVDGWVGKHKEGDGVTIADNRYKQHEKHGCMTVIEHYRIVTVKRSRCSKCGQPI